MFAQVAAAVLAVQRIAMIGDSQAFLLQRHLEPLVRQQGHEWLAIPVPGSSVIMWAEPKTPKWDIRKEWARLERWHPTTTIILLGSNDAYMGCRIIANEQPYLMRLQRRLNRMGAHTVLVGPPNLARAIKGMDCFYRQVGSSSYRLLDSRSLPLTLWDDQLHPDGPGQARWASWIFNQLQGDDIGNTTGL